MSEIAKLPFGKTGHESTRILFGAAALAMMKQERANATLDTVLEFGINHIDAAASYGDAELRLAPWLREHRDEVFLATKTGDRSRDKARESIDNSLARMGVDQIDMIQLHNLTDDAGWEKAMGPGGALEALEEARDQGRVRFIGVTGHGTQTARMHLRSLERFPFASVLLPYNYIQMQDPGYAADFNELLDVCAERGVAVQTIKSLALRRWREDDPAKHFSWYEPIKEPEAMQHAIHWALGREGVFVNTSSDGTLLRPSLEMAARFDAGRASSVDLAVANDVNTLGIEPLFVAGVSDTV